MSHYSLFPFVERLMAAVLQKILATKLDTGYVLA
jgi:hypothetical protein